MTLNRTFLITSCCARLTAAALIAPSLSPGAALAQNLGFLKETPYAKFNLEDRKRLDATIQKALAEGQDGAAIE